MLTLTNFRSEETEPNYNKIALGLGGLGIIPSVPLGVQAINTLDRTRKASKLDKKYTDIDKKLKKEQIANHPDKYINDPDKQQKAKSKFQEITKQRENNALRQERNKLYLEKNKGINKLKGFKKKFIANLEDEITANVKPFAPDTKTLNKVVKEQVTKTTKGFKQAGKVSAVLGGLALATAIGGQIAKRKQRKDKGVLRGKYNTN